MGRYDGFTNIIKLADEYGEDMRLFGASLVWNGDEKYQDTTYELKTCPLYKKISKNERKLLIDYGLSMKYFGMGYYAKDDKDARRQIYMKYFLEGKVPNPFLKEEDLEQPFGPQ